MNRAPASADRKLINSSLAPAAACASPLPVARDDASPHFPSGLILAPFGSDILSPRNYGELNCAAIRKKIKLTCMPHPLTCDGCTLWADLVGVNAEDCLPGDWPGQMPGCQPGSNGAKSAELDVISLRDLRVKLSGWGKRFPDPPFAGSCRQLFAGRLNFRVVGSGIFFSRPSKPGSSRFEDVSRWSRRGRRNSSKRPSSPSHPSRDTFCFKRSSFPRSPTWHGLGSGCLILAITQ